MGRVKITREERGKRTGGPQNPEPVKKVRKLSPAVSELGGDSETDDTEDTEVVIATKANEKVEDGGGIDTAPGFLTTGSGKRVTVSKDALRKAQAKLVEYNKGEEPDEGKGSDSGGGFLTTGSGKNVEVSRQAMKKAQERFDSYTRDDEPFGSFMKPNTGKTVSVSKEAMKQAEDKIHSFDDTAAGGFLTTGSGKKVEISQKALAKAKEKFDSMEDEPDDTGGLLTTGSGKKVNVSIEALSKAREKFDSYSADDAQGQGLLVTGSREKVELGTETLDKAKEKLNSWEASRKKESSAVADIMSKVKSRIAHTEEPSPPQVRTKRQLHKPLAAAKSPGSVRFPKRAFRAPRAAKGDSQDTVPTPKAVQEAPKAPKAVTKPSVKILDMPPGFPVKEPSAQPPTPRTTRCTDDPCFPLSGDDVSLPVTAPYFLDYLASVGIAQPTLGPLQYHYLLNKLGANQDHTTLEWVSNHLRLVCAKLSHMDHKYLPPAELQKYLCPEVVLAHLVYRYNKEYAHGARSALHTLYNKDISPTGRGLCLKFLSKCKDNVLEMTDGWYTARVGIDRLLQDRVDLHMLSPGNKIVVYSPNLMLEHAVPPLEGMANGQVLLHISFNSTRLAHEQTLLGLVKPGVQLATRLANIHPEGGQVPSIPVVVQRCYPSTITETVTDNVSQDKRYITRTLPAERIASESWRRQHEDQAAKMRAQIEAELEKEHPPLHDEATCEQVERYKSGYQQDYAEKFETMSAAVQQRELQTRCEVLITDSLTPQAPGILKLYNPPRALLDTLQEGYTVMLTNCVPAKMQNRIGYAPMVLTGSGGRCHTHVLTKVPNHVFQRRMAVHLKDIPSLKEKETFDFVGLVVCAPDAAAYKRLDKTEVHRHTVYLTDTVNQSIILKVDTQTNTRSKEVYLGSLQDRSVVGITDLTFIGKQHIVTHDGVNVCVCHVIADDKACLRSNLASLPKHLQHLGTAAQAADLKELVTSKNLQAAMHARVSNSAFTPCAPPPTPGPSNPTTTPQRTTAPYTPMSKGNPNKALFFSPPSSSRPQAFQPSPNGASPPVNRAPVPVAATPIPVQAPPALAPAVLKAPTESVMHVFGHLTLPWDIAVKGKVVTVKEGDPIPLLQDAGSIDIDEVVLRCMFSDGWSQPVQVTLGLRCLMEMFFPDTGVNEVSSTVLRKLVSGTGDHGQVREKVLTEYFAKTPFSPALTAKKLLLCLFKATLVDASAGSPKGNLIPFTERDWKDYSAAVKSYSSAFVKATLSHRECAGVQKHGSYEQPAARVWTATRVFLLSDKVRAQHLYN